MEIGATTDPLKLFNVWLQDAKNNPAIREPTAMTVASVAKTGDVNVRVVLCKQWSEEGFVFYTNYQSRKGLDIESHPQVGAGFYWDPLARQIRINGRAQRVSRQNSEAYWKSRERESQLSQYISQQSRPVASRDFLEKAVAQANTEFQGREIPCPAHWGGYLIVPERVEFWLGQPGRLHDRFEFEKSGTSWTFRRLSP